MEERKTLLWLMEALDHYYQSWWLLIRVGSGGGGVC